MKIGDGVELMICLDHVQGYGIPHALFRRICRHRIGFIEGIVNHAYGYNYYVYCPEISCRVYLPDYAIRKIGG